MQCKKFELTASAYLDGCLEPKDARKYRAHLSDCADCRERLAEIERVSHMLKDMSIPEVPRELHRYVLATVSRRASDDVPVSRRIIEWLMTLNPQAVSYTVGIVFSAVMFTIIFSVVRPIPVTGPVAEYIAIFPVVTSPDSEYHIYNDTPPDANASGNDHAYQLPRVLDNSPLASLSFAYRKPGADGMAALVEVDPDGRARLVDVLEEPSDPHLIEQLWWSLGTPAFQPARVDGRAVSTRIVLLMEKVDISG